MRLLRKVGFAKSGIPQFRYLQIGDINKSLFAQYWQPQFLTPHYQKISYSEDMLKYLRFLQRKKIVSYQDLRQFTEHLITQYHTLMVQDRPNQNIIVQKDVILPENKQTQYHGKVDWMYSINGYNPTPVMFFQKQLNYVSGIAMALCNLYMRKQTKQQFQKQFKSHIKKYNHANSYSGQNLYGYSIITTGHQWQLIRIDKNFTLQKSVILEGNNKYKTIYHDEQMVTIVLGMLDYCLELPQINVLALQKAYQYLDQRKHMIQVQDQSESKGASPLSRLLTNYFKKKL